MSTQDTRGIPESGMTWTVDDDLEAGALPYLHLPPEWLAWRDQAPEPVVLPSEDYDALMAEQEAHYHPDYPPSYGHSPVVALVVLAALGAVWALIGWVIVLIVGSVL